MDQFRLVSDMALAERTCRDCKHYDIKISLPETNAVLGVIFNSGHFVGDSKEPDVQFSLFSAFSVLMMG